MRTKLIFATVFILGIIAFSLLFIAGSAGAAPSEEWIEQLFTKYMLGIV